MGETEFRGNIMQGDGVYRTTDAGKTWTHLGLDETQAIAKIRVDPKNPTLLAMKKDNDKWLAEQAGTIPSREVLERVPAIVTNRIANDNGAEITDSFVQID